jgi:hypothetical protein
MMICAGSALPIPACSTALKSATPAPDCVSAEQASCDGSHKHGQGFDEPAAEQNVVCQGKHDATNGCGDDGFHAFKLTAAN